MLKFLAVPGAKGLFYRLTLLVLLLAQSMVSWAAFTLATTDIVVNNSVQPNTVQLTFNNDVESNAAATSVANYIVTNTGATITYRLASAQITSAKVVSLTLVDADPSDTRTYITNADITTGLLVTVSTAVKDTSGNAYSSGNNVAAAGSHVTDSTPPTLSQTVTALSNTSLLLTFSEKLSRTAATTASNYTISGSGVTTSYSASAASIDATGTKVTLTISTIAGIAQGDNLIVTASAVGLTDLAGNTLAASANAATLTIDRTPTAFSFSAVTNAPLSSTVSSAAATITGINAPVTVGIVTGSSSTLTCATLASTSTTWSSFGTCTSVTVANGDQIKLQLTTPSTAMTDVSGGITIGGVSASFRVSTAPTLVLPSSVTISAATSLNNVISNPSGSLYLSGNGAVMVPSSVTSTIALLGTAAANTVFSLASGATTTFALGSSTQTFKPMSGDAIVVLKNFTVDGYPGMQTLEISSGRAVVTGSTGIAPIASLQLGTSTTKQMVILPAGTVTPVVDIQRNMDGTGVIAIKAGKINLRVASSASVVLLADASTTLYANEVASISATGTFTKLRIGSQDGTGGVVGDALPTSVFPSNITVLAQIPKLGSTQDRADSGKTLMQSLFDFIGTRATLSQGTQNLYGLIPLLVDSEPLYFMPIGEVLVDPTAADGGILTSDGRFNITRNGVTVRLAATMADIQSLSNTMLAQGSTLVINSDGAFEISTAGKTKLFQPSFLATTTGDPNGLSTNSDGYMQYVKNGLKQILYPRFYSLPQVATTFRSFDSAMLLRDNLDGTVTATVQGQQYILRPDYEILSAVGGVPQEYRTSSYWVANGLIYLKYSNGSAQGFSIQ